MSAERTGGRDPQRTLELLWGLTEPPSRGPKPSLNVDRIIETAIEIADTEGLAAVSMRRVADELGVTTMSLYRYVPGKDDLVELMFDAGAGLPPGREEPPGPWRVELERWARGCKALYDRRPWAMQVPINGPPMGPNNLAWMDSALQALEGTGLPPEDKLYVLLLLTVYVRGEALLGFGLKQAEQRTGVTQRERDQVYARMMQRVLDDQRYPALARLAATGVFDEADDDPDADFEFGLQRILDGVEALVGARGDGGSPTLAR